MSSKQAAFRFVDLFAGVGGFHAALKAYGGECVYAVEIDRQAANVYEKNWGHPALGDITKDADDDLGIMNVPAHDVLCAGFPCQPFSKSGAQRGMEESRGTLFFNIASIIKAHHPRIVILENVRNLIGPRHEHEWEVIIETLRDEGYHVSDQAAVFSPHLLPPYMGGAPQVRERVFITATHAPEVVSRDMNDGGPAPVAAMTDRFPKAPGAMEVFNPKGDWNLEDLLDDSHNVPGCDLTPAEEHWINAWDEFVQIMRPLMNDRHLPGHPIWADAWLDFPEMGRINWASKLIKVPARVTLPAVDQSLPLWKQSHLRKNYDMFARHFEAIIPWAHYWQIYSDRFPASRRKLEWQAQETKSLWGTVMHFRPSGIRAKKPTYLPALVAITQTSIVGPRERRLSPRETARLQGLPDTFVFPGQPAAATYKQMGNGVNVGAVWHVFREHVKRDGTLLQSDSVGRSIVEAVRAAPLRPNEVLARHRPALGK
jgi:DNA (cytosine-5)-methyltransferase 1